MNDCRSLLVRSVRPTTLSEPQAMGSGGRHAGGRHAGGRVGCLLLPSSLRCLRRVSERPTRP